MAVKAAIRDGMIVLPKDALRKAHLPENGECQVEVGERMVRVWWPPNIPEPYSSRELPEEERIAWAYRGYKEVFSDREPKRRLLRLVGLGPRATVEQQREELYSLMNERVEEKRRNHGSHKNA